MGSFSVWHWVVIGLIVVVLLVAAKASSGLSGPLVVKKFFVSNTPREDGVYIEIVGRQSGLIAWLFALLRIDPTLEMRVRYTKVEYVVSNFTGFTRIVLPIESVSSVFFGVHRPWKKAVGWLLFFVVLAYMAAEMGSTGATLGLLVVGLIIAILVFVFNRLRQIGFTDVTGDDYALVLKRSVIEGQEISESQLDEITRIVLALLDAHKKPRLSHDE